MKYTKYTALYASITLALILVVAPLTSYAMLDIYRNIETGFIELAQSIRVTGNAIITGNL